MIETIKSILWLLYDHWIRFQIDLTWRGARRRAKRHGLPARLLISLTSYPPRFQTLAYTIKSLLAQSVRADEVVLWIAHKDRQALGDDVRALEADGLTIRYCDDVRSHKKYAYAFADYPGSFIAIADDDAYYWPAWLSELADAYVPGRAEIPCHRAHKVALKDQATPAAYSSWEQNTADISPSAVIFPTGLGGVLYSAGLLHSDVGDLKKAMALTPTGDDIWLYWMARRVGTVFRKIGRRRRVHNWRGSQATSLYQINVIGEDGNDRQIAAMMQAYGWNDGVASPSR